MQIVIDIPDKDIPKRGQCMLEVYFDFHTGELCSCTYPCTVLPKDHGRLVDGDGLWNKMSCYSDNEGAGVDYLNHDVNPIILRDSAMEVIENAPTIIPATKGE